MTGQMYKHTGKLSWFLLRRDRVSIFIWLLSLSLLTIVVAHVFPDLYKTEQDRQSIAATMENPAMEAMLGKAYGIDDYTYGAIMANQMLLFTMLAVAVMSILLVTRHTRSDEEAGRIELIRSLPTGRLANLNATVVVICAVHIVLALIVGLGLFALGINSMDFGGSMLYGAALGVTGIFFTAVTAVVAQLSESGQGTIGIAFAILGLSYLMRAAGDVGDHLLSWFSPLGLVLGSEVYVQNYWWPIGVTLMIALLLFGLAFYLCAIRDLEAGFIRARPGKKHASASLQSPIGLLFRTGRTAMIGWAVALFIIGASYGAIFGDLESFMKDIDLMQDLINPVAGESIIDQFIPVLMSIMAIIATIPVLMIMLRLIGEERKERIEHLLSRAVSRTRLLFSGLLLALVMSFVMLSLTGLGLWASGTIVVEEGLAFGDIYKAAMVYLPALWFMLGFVVLLIGFVPKFTGVIWFYLVYAFFAVYLGDLLQFPEWMKNISPFGHISQLPIESMNYMRAAVVTILAIGLIVAGFIGYNKRDIG